MFSLSLSVIFSPDFLFRFSWMYDRIFVYERFFVFLCPGVETW